MTTTPTDRPLRIGLQVAAGPDRDELAAVGAEAEAAGFDVVTVADHIGPGGPAPLVTLAHLAAATSRIHIGTMVLNNDMRNPVQLAWEAAGLHAISGGRLELGLGAGHTPQEYGATGIALDPPAVRKARLAEAVEILAALFQGGPVDHRGHHYEIAGAEIDRPATAPPILVGGNGPALLRHAASNADAIGLQGLGRIREDGKRHRVRWTVEHLENQLAVIAEAADAAGRRPELAALVQVAEITDDRERSMAAVLERAEDLRAEDADVIPYLAIGTVDEIADQLIAARRRWGISYFTVRNPDFGPVVARVRELDRSAP